MLEGLRHRPQTTIYTLRKQGFTLRLLLAAERNGHLALDVVAGAGAVRRDSTRPSLRCKRDEDDTGQCSAQLARERRDVL